jgi:hypothetical protein
MINDMKNETEIREALIDSCHSSKEAQSAIEECLSDTDFISLLVKIALDEEDYGGDAPMQAAFYLSKASPALTRQYEEVLIPLLTAAVGYKV